MRKRAIPTRSEPFALADNQAARARVRRGQTGVYPDYGARSQPGKREVGAANQMLDWAHEVLELDWVDVGRAVEADQRTIDRWRRGRSAPRSKHLERIHNLRDLRILLEAVLPDEKARREWLRAPVPLLHGDSPISLIRAGGLDRVIEVLAGLESGAFA